jgi:undecaprenyl-diphosphatase
MNIIKIAILALVQGAAELLPVSSSAHVIVAEKLMGLDPTTPDMTLLLVMLHTGTMFAVIAFFWNSWKRHFFASGKAALSSAKAVAVATVFTGAVGLSVKALIERFFLGGLPNAEIELLFGNLVLMSGSLASVGILIIVAGYRIRGDKGGQKTITVMGSGIIGIVQGLCLPFRGFSRSGATISAGLLLGIERKRAEELSFALAVVLTPPVLIREILRLLRGRDTHALLSMGTLNLLAPSLLGMMLSFFAGLAALRWLSRWLESGRWHFFGIYCLFASLVVFLLQFALFG